MNLYEKANELRKDYPQTHYFVMAIRYFLRNHIDKKPYKAKNILESRFTPPDEAFRKRMSSCGAIANMAVAMFRHVGLKAKFIHGEHKQSVDHAWILVYIPERKRWVEYDLTSLGTKSGYTTPKHKKKLVCDNWEEIYEQLLKDHRSYQKRKNLHGQRIKSV